MHQAVGFAEVHAPPATSPKSSKKGSAITALGETTRAGSVDKTGLVVVEVRHCRELLSTSTRDVRAC